MSINIHTERLKGHHGSIGLITLDRQERLNAISIAMFVTIHEQLTAWASDEHIKAVLVRAKPGRAFSAGGDLREIYQFGKAGNVAHLKSYFKTEYALNKFIYHYPKPYIALLDGITMGGGAGISIHGSHPIATEHFAFAMPETAVGFYPDIGASYFLSRLPNAIGMYLGLTGNTINQADAQAIGLIQYVLKHEQQPAFIEALLTVNLSKSCSKEISKGIGKLLQRFYYDVTSTSKLIAHAGLIKRHFSQGSVPAILASLSADTDPWCQNTYQTLLSNSPTSLKVTFEQLRRGANLNFDQCMQMEYNMTLRFLENHDIYEGVRAKLIDKDNQPRWQPAHLDDVSDERVASYFSERLS